MSSASCPPKTNKLLRLSANGGGMYYAAVVFLFQDNWSAKYPAAELLPAGPFPEAPQPRPDCSRPQGSQAHI
ncbi:hypothetical protein WJX72_005506 [[Myrmecia] bisecta]|uniref:Uncharacterized protein n=1 Tax=[Myrmecia] bisecta TaxID=41462 RepID=A0AAW1R7L2_9CHLO